MQFIGILRHGWNQNRKSETRSQEYYIGFLERSALGDSENEKHIDFMKERCERFVVVCAIELFYFIFHLRDKLVALDDERSLRKQFGILLFDLVLQLLVHPA